MGVFAGSAKASQQYTPICYAVLGALEHFWKGADGIDQKALRFRATDATVRARLFHFSTRKLSSLWLALQIKENALVVSRFSFAFVPNILQ